MIVTSQQKSSNIPSRSSLAQKMAENHSVEPWFPKTALNKNKQITPLD